MPQCEVQGHYKLLDGKGLYFEVNPNGVKAWRYRFELREDAAVKESLERLCRCPARDDHAVQQHDRAARWRSSLAGAPR
jgi:hypothetical protein